VKTTYTILDQRLVAATQTLEELAYDTGKKIASRKTLNIAGEAASS
jgi:hypothetical protein